eukprot:363970-Chlamydomonas_euryale.AAC.20
MPQSRLGRTTAAAADPPPQKSSPSLACPGDHPPICRNRVWVVRQRQLLVVIGVPLHLHEIHARRCRCKVIAVHVGPAQTCHEGLETLILNVVDRLAHVLHLAGHLAHARAGRGRCDGATPAQRRLHNRAAGPGLRRQLQGSRPHGTAAWPRGRGAAA